MEKLTKDQTMGHEEEEQTKKKKKKKRGREEIETMTSGGAHLDEGTCFSKRVKRDRSKRRDEDEMGDKDQESSEEDENNLKFEGPSEDECGILTQIVTLYRRRYCRGGKRRRRLGR